MARLPPPLPPPRRSSRSSLARPLTPSLAPVALTIAPLDDEASLAKTIERRPGRTAASIVQARVEACILQTRTTLTELLRDPRGAIGAAVWTACVVAGITGVLLGHARHARPAAHATTATAATTSVAVHDTRAVHERVVLEAREEITERAVLAATKDNAVDEETPATAATASPKPTASHAQRRSGFGHLGADRVASGGTARRPAPHRR